MSIYQKLTTLGERFFSRATLFKYGFNYSPMYRRSTARITEIADDLTYIRIELPISWRNRNYVNSIFGGSMFSAVDPIPMIQIMQLLGNEYVVWDKSARVFFRRPARENLYADFRISNDEIEEIKKQVAQTGETEVERISELKNRAGDRIYCEVQKTIYVARKDFYKEKLKNRKKEG